MEMLRSPEPAQSPTAAANEVLSRRALLARQMLLARETPPAVRAVERLIAMQAQAPLAPYVGLWTRLEGFRTDDLADRINGRDLVRIALIRGTVHLVSAVDCLELRPLIQPVLDRALKTGYGKRLTGLDVEEVAAEGRALVEERPRTFADLGASLGARRPDACPLRPPPRPAGDPERLLTADIPHRRLRPRHLADLPRARPHRPHRRTVRAAVRPRPYGADRGRRPAPGLRRRRRRP